MSPTPAYRRREPPRTRITRISRAPLLSATRRRDSFWIIAAQLRHRRVAARSARETSSSSGALQNALQPPALGPRQRAALAHDHRVADMRLPSLVVRVQGARRANDLLVPGVPVGAIDSDGDGFGCAIGDHHALAGLLAPGSSPTGLRLRGSRKLFLACRPLPRTLFPQPRTRLTPQLSLPGPRGLALLGRIRSARTSRRFRPSLSLLGGED